MSMKPQGIPMMAFLIVAAICGAVGYVAGKMSNQRLIDQGLHQGFLKEGRYGLEWDYYTGFEELSRSRDKHRAGMAPAR